MAVNQNHDSSQLHPNLEELEDDDIPPREDLFISPILGAARSLAFSAASDGESGAEGGADDEDSEQEVRRRISSNNLGRGLSYNRILKALKMPDFQNLPNKLSETILKKTFSKFNKVEVLSFELAISRSLF